jgi:hypothetical protein
LLTVPPKDYVITVTTVLLAISGDGRLPLSSEGEVLSCNRAAASLFGLGLT